MPIFEFLALPIGSIVETGNHRYSRWVKEADNVWRLYGFNGATAVTQGDISFSLGSRGMVAAKLVDPLEFLAQAAGL